MISPKRRKVDIDLKSQKCDLNRTKPVLYSILSDDLIEDTPLLEVYVDEISNPKDISKVVVAINNVFSLPKLLHLKRIKGRSVLLFPKSVCHLNEVHQYLEQKGFDTSVLSNKVHIVSVAKVPPKVRNQYDKVHKLWPCNFHANKYLEKLVSNNIFNEVELNHHEIYMRIAIEVAEFAEQEFQSRKVGAVILDPKRNSVVAIGYDISQHHPCKHAVMVAIDNVAVKQNGGVWQIKADTDGKAQSISGIPEGLNFLRNKCNSIEFGTAISEKTNILEKSRDVPYLCTDYCVYVTHEPCLMCAMAMIHSRVKRVFYGVKTSNGGVCSLCKIQVTKDLNHHYEVFGGLLENECLALDTKI